MEEQKRYYREDETHTAKTVQMVRYTFPCIRKDGGSMWSMDGKTKVNYPFYHKFDDGSMESLSREEKDYTLRVTEIVVEYGEKLKRLNDEYQKTVDFLSKIKGSVLEYIKYRLRK